MNRRDFVGALTLGSLPAGRILAAEAGTDAVATRPPTAQRPVRRIIWNNDGDDLRMVAFGVRHLWNARDNDNAPLTERFGSVREFLDLRMSALRDTPVDTISYCGVFTWPVWEFPRDRISALGEDPLKRVVDFAHASGKEFFFNLRMNDCHSSGRNWQGPVWWEPFRLRNRHLLQATISAEAWEKDYLPWIRGESSVYPLQAALDRRGGGNRDVQSWSAFDYARAEVREYFVGLVREACERYDVDGIDLDWLRMPFFFRFGEERRNVPLMNDFVRRVADTVRAASRRRERPIVLAMRVPDSPERALEIGLDVETWMAEGWLDLLVAGNGLASFSMPFASWTRLAASRNIPVYGCITRSAPGLSDPAAVRGACHRLWVNGVNGLYFFNHFIPSEYGTIADAADPARLKTLTKTYAIDTSSAWSQNGTVCLGPLPLNFPNGAAEASIELSLEIPEDPRSAESVRMAVQWRGANAEGRSRWRINGSEMRLLNRGERGALEYDGAGLKAGLNRLRVTVTSGSPAEAPGLVLETVRVTVARI
jgi:hypothetical protein